MTLADRAARYLELAGGPLHLETLARGLRARTIHVRDALRHDPRFDLVQVGSAAKWALRPAVAQEPRDARPARVSQNDRVLAALADGRWRTVPELHARVGPCRLNSRVAELRKRGHRIECRTVAGRVGPARYEYRLVSGADGSSPDAGAPGPHRASAPAWLAPDDSLSDAPAGPDPHQGPATLFNTEAA